MEMVYIPLRLDRLGFVGIKIFTSKSEAALLKDAFFLFIIWLLLKSHCAHSSVDIRVALRNQ